MTEVRSLSRLPCVWATAGWVPQAAAAAPHGGPGPAHGHHPALRSPSPSWPPAAPPPPPPPPAREVS